jgi:glycosyltransferase involved in cell wall biosynthesis
VPGDRGVPYYREIYDGIKRDFGDLPHVIFGRQTTPFADPAVLPYLTESGLYELYARAPAFVYPSAEPRHVHYSPVEAMVVGAPVLYRRGALLDGLAGELLPGACTGAGEMRAKAEALLAGDPAPAADIRASQPQIVDAFSIELAQRQWRGALDGVGVRRSGRPS